MSKTIAYLSFWCSFSKLMTSSEDISGNLEVRMPIS